MRTMRRLRYRIADFLWRRRRCRFSDEAWELPPDAEGALVPVGSPKRPRPSSAVALELPPPEQWDVEAYGPIVEQDQSGESSAEAA
jgi:hypothetical protein